MRQIKDEIQKNISSTHTHPNLKENCSFGEEIKKSDSAWSGAIASALQEELLHNFCALVQNRRCCKHLDDCFFFPAVSMFLILFRLSPAPQSCWGNDKVENDYIVGSDFSLPSTECSWFPPGWRLTWMPSENHMRAALHCNDFQFGCVLVPVSWVHLWKQDEIDSVPVVVFCRIGWRTTDLWNNSPLLSCLLKNTLLCPLLIWHYVHVNVVSGSGRVP